MAASSGLFQTPPMEADELRTDTSHLIMSHCPHIKSNISIEEYKAIKELREDQTRVVLTVDKGVTMVAMDKQDYVDKALTLLTDTSTYNTINKDPTTRLRNRLISTQQGGLSDTTWRKLYPTRAVPLSFMAFPKSAK